MKQKKKLGRPLSESFPREKVSATIGADTAKGLKAVPFATMGRKIDFLYRFWEANKQ